MTKNYWLYLYFFIFGSFRFLVPKKVCGHIFRKDGWPGVFEYYRVQPKQMIYGFMPVCFITAFTCLFFATIGHQYLNGLAESFLNFVMAWQIIATLFVCLCFPFNFFKIVKMAFKRERLKRRLRSIKPSLHPNVESNKSEGEKSHDD